MDDTFERESAARLIRAEQTGLRIALACRSAATGAAFIWYVLAAVLFPDVTPRLATIGVLLAFTAVGVAHVAIIGTTYDRPWIKFAIYGLDVCAICAVFALVPISRADDVPQIIAFRAYGIYFLFPLLAMACLSLSWRLVLWTGGTIITAWWAAFIWVQTQMESYLSWGDMPTDATQADYENVFLSIDFIGRGNRIEETGMVFFATLALAAAVYRARAVFFAQVAADIDRQKEQTLRERVSDLLGRHVPEAIAARLIEDDAPLRPQRTRGTALVMDVAGFTAFSAQHPPEHVIETLDALLSDTAKVVSEKGGVVLSYLGDGFLATFNTPVFVTDHETAALAAAKDLVTVAKAHGFDVRIGIASGDLVTGIIGNETRQSFTVYGDAVNLASRLEGLGKDLKSSILLDEATGVVAGDVVELTRLGAHPIRGVDGQIEVFAASSAA
ncbi:adenylate/guanylate cyclase domain-containing protein [uncultured Tateyamaria sp.]|uniref:adenylate/guanylate cyclase domain-containing protein n=1 Tax=uncultured Tateyamaria sp. TaxID=455651 RepID=UPI002624A647|nr:adenylate/guanylate cyclase domain-containing protein [uncultured Tateyamaria sp.]